MIKGAIFDMDGTVLDSMHLWHRIGPRILEHLGIDPGYDIQKDTGNMLYEEMNNYFTEKGFTHLTLDEFAQIADSMAEKGYFYEVLVKPGVVDFLEQLTSRGIPIALATATDRYMVDAVLKRNGIDRYFPVIFTCNELGCDKKVTTIYDAARKALGTPENETYVFEDTLTPIKALTPTGYRVVGVADKWSAHNREKIIELADIFVDNLSDLNIDEL